MAKQLYDHFYTSRERFNRLFRETGCGMRFKGNTPSAARNWQRRARAKLSELLGLDRMEPAAPRAQRTAVTDCGDHVREHWLMRTEKGVVMPFYLLRPPDDVAGPLPAVICPHGHCSGGKISPAGVGMNKKVKDTIEQHNYDYGVQLAREGFLTFCPDARGFGERQEKEARNSPLDSSCYYLQMMAVPLGIPVAGMWTFDLMRLVDYVASRPDVRPSRIGCAGLSGGGLQTLFLSAVDTRIACSVISGYFYGALESLLELPGNCACNMVPHLWEHLDMGDVGGLIAPRPTLIETGDEDGLNGAPGLKNVKSQVSLSRRAYRGLGATRKLSHAVFRGPHRWDGTEAIPWLKKWLMV